MKKSLIIGLAGIYTSLLWADFTLEYQMPENTKQTVQYKDAQHVLITTKDASSGGSGLLIVGEKRYVVMQENGTPRYMDMDVIMKQTGAAYGADIPGADEASSGVPDFKIVKKKGYRTVAGIKGEVWTVAYSDEGRTEQTDVVVTDNRRVVDAVRKYAEAMQRFSGMEGAEGSDFSSLFSIKKGVVAIALEGITLTKYDDHAVPDAVFALPERIRAGASSKTAGAPAAKKPALCPMSGSHGKAKQLTQMLQPKSGGWKLIENGTCIDMMNMTVENAVYEKSGAYIHITLSVNVDGEQGMIAKYRTHNMKVGNLKQGKLQGKPYQSGHLERAGVDAMDITLENAVVSLTATDNAKDDLYAFAEHAFALGRFVPAKKSKPGADDTMKSLGSLFGSASGSADEPQDGSQEDDGMQKAAAMFKGMFGQ